LTQKVKFFPEQPFFQISQTNPNLSFSTWEMEIDLRTFAAAIQRQVFI